jgi:transposase
VSTGPTRRARKPAKPAGGRPTKLNPEAAERALTVLRAGGHAEVAAQAAGVALRTWQEWLQRGDPRGRKAADSPFRAFRRQVAEAEAAGEARHIALIARAGTTSWQAAAWLLERRHPERWARPAPREVEVAAPAAPAAAPDPFAEVDELARRRRQR